MGGVLPELGTAAFIAPPPAPLDSILSARLRRRGGRVCGEASAGRRSRRSRCREEASWGRCSGARGSLPSCAPLFSGSEEVYRSVYAGLKRLLALHIPHLRSRYEFLRAAFSFFFSRPGCRLRAGGVSDRAPAALSGTPRQAFAELWLRAWEASFWLYPPAGPPLGEFPQKKVRGGGRDSAAALAPFHSVLFLTGDIAPEKMGKGCKVVVCGLLSVGKTAILEQLLYGNHTIGKMIFTSFPC
ncbi:NF-kappa-B inhibitor-interacting Ras-like protein 1 [Galemys pyrenaicus]|uniref:NF-kappa-B inhibitor-interacting Ras-like protein 1 n=1 Tax=Galemys pyrenaicus TaxID=202257 RepID=A0A8J6A6C5_GALPY|nr:NF-kappa-B inhibitor-interacting Ras-like protein 1 [Galemys pyrenaicus]